MIGCLNTTLMGLIEVYRIILALLPNSMLPEILVSPLLPNKNIPSIIQKSPAFIYPFIHSPFIDKMPGETIVQSVITKLGEIFLPFDSSLFDTCNGLK